MWELRSQPFPHKLTNVEKQSLPSTGSVTDLGIVYDCNLTFSMHTDKLVSKASLRSKLILKCFTSRNPELLIKAFITFVRPILEYGCVVWSPYLKYDILKIERVQKYFTKQLKGMYYLSYVDRLELLNLCSLEIRRIKNDLIMCSKVLKSLVDVNVVDFFILSGVTLTRGNSLKLKKSCVANVSSSSLFHNRVINIWNALPDDIVCRATVKCFKERLAHFDPSSFTKLY